MGMAMPLTRCLFTNMNKLWRLIVVHKIQMVVSMYDDYDGDDDHLMMMIS